MGELDEFRRRSGELQARGAALRESLTKVAHASLLPGTGQILNDALELLEDAGQKLSKGEQLVSAIFEGSLDGFALTDSELRFVDVNRAAAELFGLPKSALLGHRGSEFAVPGFDAAKKRQEFRRAGELIDEVSIRRADGSVRVVEFAAKANIVPGLNFTVLRDVTERRRLEEQARQTQKMEAVGSLAAGVAHDFNNLLSVMLSYTELVLNQLEPQDPVRADLEEVHRAARLAGELTGQLLAFGRRQALSPRVVDVNATIVHIEAMLRRVLGEDIAFAVALARDAWSVFVDRGQLEQVIMNLVVNARDAMPAGGMLTIETANVELDEDYAARHVSVEPGRYVMLAVSDTGVGMDKLVQARIFEPFFTTKPVGRGSGLGLATVFGIVKQSNGQIWVYSEPGAGTTFKVYFPRTESAERAAESQVSAGADVQAMGAGETVLLAEDDDQLRGLASTLLRRSGYRVLEARNAGEALLIADDPALQVDLLLTDVVMPLLSGPRLAARLAATRLGLKVLYMSGYTDAAIVRHGGLDDRVAFIQKPLVPRELLRKVREVLAAAEG